MNVYYANFLVEGGVTLRENTPLAQQFDGLYSLGVWGAREGINGNRVSFPISISQTGTIPINAQRLTIHAYVTDYEVKIDGQLVQSDSTHTSFDVSPFAGREVALEITFKSGYAGDFEIHGFTSVPEPSEMAMLGTGLIVLGWQVWRRR